MAKRVVTGPWISVARPRNWQSALLSALLVLGWILVALLIVLVKLPVILITSYAIDPILLRLALICFWYYIAFTFSPLIYGFLPAAPVLWGRRLWLQVRGKRHRIALADIDAVEIEMRPRGPIATVQMSSGLKLDLCPISWTGADSLMYRLRARRARIKGNRRLDQG